MGTVTPRTDFPDHLTAGTTWMIQRSYSDYPASQGWTVTFNFVNASASLPTQTSAAAGDDHLLTVAATVTATFAAGIYKWQATATSSDSTPLVEIAESGTVEVLPLLSAAGASDQRSHARKVLDAIHALIEGKATQDVQEFDVQTATTVRRIKTLPWPDLMKAKDRYEALVAQEQLKEDIKRGKKRTNKIYARFP